VSKKSIVAILAVACLAVYVSCTRPPKGTNTQGPVLSVQPLTDSIAPAPSVVNIPLRIHTRVIEDLVNGQINGQLYAFDSLALGAFKPVKIKVWKGDSIKIGLEGNELHYTVPLRIWLEFALTVGALGLSHTEYQEFEAALSLKFTSRLSIGPDWKLTTKTQSDGYAWLTDPVVKIRFITIPIKPIADILLASQQKTISDIIDKQAVALCNVKTMIQPVWDQLQEGIAVSKDPEVWLRLTPQEIYLSPLLGYDGALVSRVGIKSVVETFLGDKPACGKKDSIPNFILPTGVDSSFVLNVYSEMNYDAATLLLRGLLIGKDFKSGSRQVIIQDVTMTGVSGYALIGLDLIGSFNGRVYVYGSPRFDPSTDTVSIENLNFDISTQNLAHKTANWLLHGAILSSVKPFLKFSLRQKLLESQRMVQKTLSRAEIAKNVFLVGAVDSLRIGGVRLTDNAVRALVFAKGSMHVEAHN